MKELKVPSDIYLEEFDLHIRPYLTSEEIMGIGDLALEAENPIEREMTIIFNVMVCCTDLTEDEVKDMNVDEITLSGLWNALQLEIIDIHRIWDYIKYFDSPSVAIARFLNKTLPHLVDEYIDKLPKDGEWEQVIEKLPKSLSDVLEIAKQDGNADIIRGAFKMGELNEGEDE